MKSMLYRYRAFSSILNTPFCFHLYKSAHTDFSTKMPLSLSFSSLPSPSFPFPSFPSPLLSSPLLFSSSLLWDFLSGSKSTQTSHLWRFSTSFLSVLTWVSFLLSSSPFALHFHLQQPVCFIEEVQFLHPIFNFLQRKFLRQDFQLGAWVLKLWTFTGIGIPPNKGDNDINVRQN